MHIEAPKDKLVEALTLCQGVADKKSTMPVLGNVLLDASDGALRVAATDLNRAISTTIPAEVKRPGSFAFGARDLLERAKYMPDGGNVRIDVDESAKATIRSTGSRRYTISGLPGEEFPTLPQPDPDARVLTLRVDVLTALINATHFSVSADETRLHLNSALLEWDGAVVRMVSTDGHRLSKREASVEKGRASMLIPLKGIQEIRRLCGTAEGDAVIELTQSGPNAFFRLAGVQLSIKLVDAQFPPYHQVIPEGADKLVRAPRVDLAEALKAVSVAASGRTGGVRLTVRPGKLLVESESPDSGQGSDEVAVDYDGPELTIGFCARYLLDALGAIETEEVTIALSGELDPATVKPSTEVAGESGVWVIMPMRC